MADPVVYIRGPFPVGQAFEVSPDLVKRAKVLLRFDLGTLERVGVALESYERFLDKDVVESLISPILGDQESASEIAKLVMQLHRQLRLPGQTLKNLINEINEWRGENSEELSEVDFTDLKSKLLMIVRLYPGLARLEKAEWVSKAIGLEFEDVQLICDLRPVFTKDHRIVEGYVPLTTLKLVCTGVDGLPVTLEARLSARDVTTLADRVETARKKLHVLEIEVQRMGSYIPRIDMTIQKDKDAKP